MIVSYLDKLLSLPFIDGELTAVCLEVPLLCGSTGSVTTGPGQLHAAKSSERKNPYNYLEGGDEGGL